MSATLSSRSMSPRDVLSHVLFDALKHKAHHCRWGDLQAYISETLAAEKTVDQATVTRVTNALIEKVKDFSTRGSSSPSQAAPVKVTATVATSLLPQLSAPSQPTGVAAVGSDGGRFRLKLEQQARWRASLDAQVASKLARDLEDAATDHHFATLVLASDLEERAEDRAQSLARQAAVDEAQSLAASQAAQGREAFMARRKAQAVEAAKTRTRAADAAVEEKKDQQVAKRAERQAAAECMALIRSEAGERRAFESTQRAREQAAEVAAIRAALDEAARTGKATVRGRRHIPSAAAGALSGNPTSFTEPGSGGGGPPLALPSRSSILAQPGSHDEATDKRAIDYDASAAAATEAALAAVAMARRAERRTEYLASVIKREEADRGRVWERAVRADATEAAALRTAEVTAAEAAIAATGRGVRATALRTQMHASDVKHDDTLASRRHGQAGSESAFAIPETRSSDLDLDSLARVLARFRGPIASGATIGDHAPA